MHCAAVVRRRWSLTVLASVVFLGASEVLAASPANQPPTISGQPATLVQVGSQYSFRPTASDPEGKKLRFSITNQPPWSTFNTTSGQLSGAPGSSHVGAYSNINIRVTDGRRVASLPAFSITVQAAASNTAPVISGSPASTVVAGNAYVFQPSASDANGDPLTFSVTNAPAWATFSTSTGRLSGTPTSSHVGTYSSIVIRASDGTASTALSAFSISVTAAANRAPTISGSPASSVAAGQPYSFRPSASDADGDALVFSIQNRPNWATFSTITGQLTGTPTTADVGSYGNIVISVSDGRASVSLPAFAIVVTQVSNGNVTLSWTPPTQNTDGSALTNLAGYRIHYGTSATALTQNIQIANAGITTYVIENLSAGMHYFAVNAYNSNGAESADSPVAAKLVQ